ALDALPPLPCRASPVSPVARRPTRAERPGPSPLVPKCTSPDGERRSADNRTDVPTGRLSRAGRITTAARGRPQCPDDLVSTDLEPSPAISARGGGDSLLRVEPRSRLASTLEVPAIVGGPSRTRTLDPLIKQVEEARKLLAWEWRKGSVEERLEQEIDKSDRDLRIIDTKLA